MSQLKSKVMNILEEASLKCVKQGLSKQDPFHTYKNEVQKHNKDFDKMTEEERDQIYRDNWEKLSQSNQDFYVKLSAVYDLQSEFKGT